MRISMRLTAVAVLFSLAICFSKSIARASSVATESSAAAAGADESTDYASIDLHALSNDELVAICTDRGFELVTDVDDATGEPLSYSHDDYVDAARECLQLEAEMEEYLASNPNMLKEMEEERDRMLKEQEELERQLKEAQDQLNVESLASPGESTAFVKDESRDPTADTNGAVTFSKETEGESIARDEIVNEGSKAADTPGPADLKVEDDEIIDLDDVMKAESAGAAENSEKLAGTVTNEDQTSANNSANSEVASNPDSGHHGLVVELKEVITEFCEKVKQDFNRVADIVLPKPMRGPLKRALKKGYDIGKEMTLQAVDMIKRYSKVLMEKGKTAYENRRHMQEQKKDNNASDIEQEKATADDIINI